MLNNVEGNQPTADETPIIDTSHELKWKRTYRKRLINCLALIENHGRPTTELLYEQRKAKEALNGPGGPNGRDLSLLSGITETIGLIEKLSRIFSILNQFPFFIVGQASSNLII